MPNYVHKIKISLGNCLFKIFFFDFGFSSEKETSDTAILNFPPNCHILFFCIKGTHLLQTRKGEVTLNSNELLILPPNSLQDYSFSHALNFYFRYISLSLEQCDDSLNLYEYFADTLEKYSLYPLPLPNSILQKVLQMKTWGVPNSIKNYCYLHAQFSTFLFELFDNLTGFFEHSDLSLPTTHTNSEELIVLLNTMISSRNMTLSEIAEELHYSERHIARLIKQIYSMTLSEIYNIKPISSMKSDESSSNPNL